MGTNVYLFAVSSLFLIDFWFERDHTEIGSFLAVESKLLFLFDLSFIFSKSTCLISSMVSIDFDASLFCADSFTESESDVLLLAVIISDRELGAIGDEGVFAREDGEDPMDLLSVLDVFWLFLNLSSLIK